MNDFTRAGKKVASFPERISERMSNQLEEGLGDTRNDARTTLRRHDAYASGSLWRAIHVRDVPDLPDSVETLSLTAEEPHAAAVEHGTGIYTDRGYPAPTGLPESEIGVANIYQWIVDKNIVPREYPTRLDLAFAIAETIDGRGTPKQPFMRPAWFRNTPLIRTRLNRAFRKGTR